MLTEPTLSTSLFVTNLRAQFVMLSSFFGIDFWKFESEPDDSTTSNRFDCEEGDKLLEQVSAIAATLLCSESSDREFVSVLITWLNFFYPFKLNLTLRILRCFWTQLVDELHCSESSLTLCLLRFLSLILVPTCFCLDYLLRDSAFLILSASCLALSSSKFTGSVDKALAFLESRFLCIEKLML